jgi:hypothetical protein
VVQKVFIRAGDSVEMGDDVAIVNGIRVGAYTGDLPIVQTLRLGDVGPEVAVLNHFLAFFGGEGADGNSPEYTLLTKSRVAKYASSRGMDGATGEVFDPSWVLFFSQLPSTVDSVSLSVGGVAPTLGEVVAGGRPLLEGARLEMPTSGDDGVVTNVWAASEEISLNGDGITVSSIGLEALQLLTDETTETLEVSVRRTAQRDEFSIPAPALVMDRAGGVCVLVRREGLEIGAVPVDVVGTWNGTAQARGKLMEGDAVEVAPSGEKRVCG